MLNRQNYHLEEKKSYPWLELFCALVAAFSFFIVGTLRGYTSPAIYELEKERNFNNQTFTQDESAWFASAPPLTAFIGALLGSLPLQFLGRQKTILLLGIPALVGWLLIYFGVNVIMVIVGRACTGIAAGLAISSAQLYISECSRPKVRGILGFLPAIMLALGIFVGLVVGTELNWRLAALVLGIFPVLLFIISLFLPETPTWLLLSNREEDALDNLHAIRGSGREVAVQQEMDELKKHIEDIFEQNSNLGRWQSIIFRQEIWWPTSLAVCLMLAQQLSGVNAVIYYFDNILNDAEKMSGGHKSSLALDKSVLLFGAVQVLACFISIPLIDTLGRKFLLTTSALLMALSHLSIGVFFYCCEHNFDDFINLTACWLPLTSLCAFIVSYSIGFSAVPYIVTSEVFPPHLRSYLCSLSSLVNLLTTFLVVRFFLPLKDGLHPGYVYFLFGLLCLASILIVRFVLPETKGKSLVQISMLFQDSDYANSYYSDVDIFDPHFNSLDSKKSGVARK